MCELSYVGLREQSQSFSESPTSVGLRLGEFRNSRFVVYLEADDLVYFVALLAHLTAHNPAFTINFTKL